MLRVLILISPLPILILERFTFPLWHEEDALMGDQGVV